jgi:hypothetical protein
MKRHVHKKRVSCWNKFAGLACSVALLCLLAYSLASDSDDPASAEEILTRDAHESTRNTVLGIATASAGAPVGATLPGLNVVDTTESVVEKAKEVDDRVGVGRVATQPTAPTTTTIPVPQGLSSDVCCGMVISSIDPLHPHSGLPPRATLLRGPPPLPMVLLSYHPT